MNNILVSPNDTKFALTVTDSGVLGTIKVSDDKNNEASKINIIAVISDVLFNSKHNELLKNLMNKENKLIHINTCFFNGSLSINDEISIRNQYLHFIKISNEILFINGDNISDESLKFIKYALDLNKPVHLYKPMEEEQFNKLLED